MYTRKDEPWYSIGRPGSSSDDDVALHIGHGELQRVLVDG